MTRFDVIVLGVGGVGSAAAWHIARRGHTVLGLDRFSPGHDRGSSHGQTRIIRNAYFEHPDYVPLLNRAYELWGELEESCGEQLYFPTGLIEIGPPDGVVLQGVVESARRFDLRIDTLTAKDVSDRFPGFAMPDGCQAVFEREAGFLLVERGVQQHARAAERAGATIRPGVDVRGWSANRDGVVVMTNQETYRADRLVITAGAWAADLLSDLSLPWRVLRKHLHWYGSDSPTYQAERGCPAFIYDLDADHYYGFPQIDARGVKVAEHSRGTQVTDVLGDDRSMEHDDQRRVEQFIARCLPLLNGRSNGHSVCYYTMSPDQHFIVDRHPLHDRVAFAAGLSGHGYKFTNVLGEILADLVVEGRTDYAIEFLRCGRFA